jgi:hypothetical protein
MRHSLLLLSFLLMTPAVAQTTGQLSGAVQSHNVSQKLANMVLPRDALVAARLPEFEALSAEEHRADPKMIALEKSQPGIIDAVIAASRDEAAKSCDKAIDLLRTDVAKLYAQKFKPEELQTLVTFFSTPVGQAMIMMSAQTSGITPSALEAERRKKLIAALQNPDEQAKADLTKLMESGLVPKIQAIAPEISALAARRFNDINDMLEAALPARIEQTIANYSKTAKP